MWRRAAAVGSRRVRLQHISMRSCVSSQEPPPVTSSSRDTDGHSRNATFTVAPPFMGAPTPFRHKHLSRAELDALAMHPLTHCVPTRVSDHVCIRMVRVMRWLADRCFREALVHRALILKLVASAPPAAALFVDHIRSIIFWSHKATTRRTGAANGGDTFDERVQARLQTLRFLHSFAECQHTHAVMVLAVTKLSVAERCLLLVAQAVHFAAFTVLFSCSTRMGYRLMGYLLEESTVILTHMINDIDADKISSATSPPHISLSFWGLQQRFSILPDARGAEESAAVDETGVSPASDFSAQHASSTSEDDMALPKKSEESSVLSLRDVALLMRGDEMFYRDGCHAVANRIDAVRNQRANQGAPPTAFR